MAGQKYEDLIILKVNFILKERFSFRRKWCSVWSYQNIIIDIAFKIVILPPTLFSGN